MYIDEIKVDHWKREAKKYNITFQEYLLCFIHEKLWRIADIVDPPKPYCPEDEKSGS